MVKLGIHFLSDIMLRGVEVGGEKTSWGCDLEDHPTRVCVSRTRLTDSVVVKWWWIDVVVEIMKMKVVG